MDALSDVLNASQLTGGVFLHAELFAPWCMSTRVDPEQCGPQLGSSTHVIPYHYIVEGTFDICIDGHKDETLTLSAGDVVLLPRNEVHWMGSDLNLVPVSSKEMIRPSGDGGLHRIRYGGSGAATRLICGYLGCNGTESNPVVASLPAMLKLESGKTATWIHANFAYAAQAIAAGRPGTSSVLAKLSELMFVEAVRIHIESLPASQTGWLAGLREPHVSKALSLMHADVSRRWTVDEICREVGLSRSALADRFTRLIGKPPMHYLADWRMQVATRKLLGTNASLAQIAEIVGYDSEAAFSRAFKKAYGTAPATWRRSKRA